MMCDSGWQLRGYKCGDILESWAQATATSIITEAVIPPGLVGSSLPPSEITSSNCLSGAAGTAAPSLGANSRPPIQGQSPSPCLPRPIFASRSAATIAFALAFPAAACPVAVCAASEHILGNNYENCNNRMGGRLNCMWCYKSDIPAHYPSG